MMLLGVQGCGKSLCVKAIANSWKLPLLRFDIGRMFSSLVGSSEENIRRAVQIAESVAPCIFWCDEIDKALSGATSSGGSDGGTSSRVFGTLLTWLSEKTAPVFSLQPPIISAICPPSYCGKDDWTKSSLSICRTITSVALCSKFILPSEVAILVNSIWVCYHKPVKALTARKSKKALFLPLFDAFSKQVKLNTDIIQANLRETVPLSRTMSEDLERLRNWASGRARPASSNSGRLSRKFAGKSNFEAIYQRRSSSQLSILQFEVMYEYRFGHHANCHRKLAGHCRGDFRCNCQHGI